jgi:hypothetical protein
LESAVNQLPLSSFAKTVAEGGYAVYYYTSLGSIQCDQILWIVNDEIFSDRI